MWDSNVYRWQTFSSYLLFTDTFFISPSNLPHFYLFFTNTTKFSKGETASTTREIMQGFCVPPVHHNIVLLLCPGFTSLQAKHSHTLIPALKFMKIISVIFSQCLPACYIYLYITTLLNQFKVGRSHDYIEEGRRGGERKGHERERGGRKINATR